MIAKLVSLALVFALLTGVTAAQPGPKKADEKKLVTKVYDIKHLIGERGKPLNVSDADAVIKVLFDAIPQLQASKAGADGPQIIERDGGKLEIRATAEAHGEIKDLIAAIERLQDVAIDIKAEVIELDLAAFEKFQKALPKAGKGKPGSPVLFATGEDFEENRPTAAEQKALEEANNILKAGRVVQTSSGRFANGAEATIAARRTIVTYTNAVDGLAQIGKNDNPLFVKEGFGLVAAPVVSADRRYVRFKLTEQSTAITGIKKREIGEIGGKTIVGQTPVVEDIGSTGSTVIADGGTAIFKLNYAPKDKVWVVVLKPIIFIKAEEEEIQRQRLKMWLDLFRGR